MRHTVSTRTRNRPRFGNHTCQPATLSSALALTVALTLSACGGGGGGTDSSSGSASAPGNPASPSTPSTPLAPSTPTSSLAQGRWVSSGVTPAYSVVTVPASTGANTPALDTVWALAQDASTLIKLTVNGAGQTPGAVTGSVYTLGTSTVSTVSSASYSVQSTASGPQMSLQPLLGTTALFDRTDAMSTGLDAAQANGRWLADLGTAKVTWTVQSAATGTNNLSGSSTTGCTYSGQSSVVATQSLYRVQFTETCAGTTLATQNFIGVATVSPDNNRLTLVATNEQNTRAAALLFTRQP